MRPQTEPLCEISSPMLKRRRRAQTTGRVWFPTLQRAGMRQARKANIKPGLAIAGSSAHRGTSVPEFGTRRPRRLFRKRHGRGHRDVSSGLAQSVRDIAHGLPKGRCAGLIGGVAKVGQDAAPSRRQFASAAIGMAPRHIAAPVNTSDFGSLFGFISILSVPALSFTGDGYAGESILLNFVQKVREFCQGNAALTKIGGPRVSWGRPLTGYALIQECPTLKPNTGWCR